MDTIDTAEPDEFARLLAQLNGEPDPAAAPLVGASAPVAPAAPLLPPAPQVLAPMTPPLVPATPPLAPAFGMATPMPAPVSAHPASPPAILPPVTLAPELMGADELAAPPSAPSALAPPVEPDAPTLVSPPPVAETPLAAASPLVVTPLAATLATAPPPLASASPVRAPAPAPGAAASTPAWSIAQAAPLAAAPPMAAPAVRSGAPLDFAALLSTPAGADDAPSAAATPLVFGGGSPDASDAESDIGRSTLFEKIGLVLAVLVAPVGLIVGIVNAIRSSGRRGWVVGIVRATIAVGAVLTVALGVGGYYEYTQYQQQLHHDQIAADSAAFCATLTANPSMYQPPTFGWPAVAASIPDTLTAMQAFEDRWTKLEKVSPAGIRGDVSKEATAAKQIIDSVTVSRVVDDASNVAVMSSVASSSGVPAWHTQYCG